MAPDIPIEDVVDPLPTPWPPSDYTIEPELVGEIPRPIPQEILHGPVFRRRRLALRWCFAVGLVCLALAPLPVVRLAGMFLLPLAFLGYIGAGLLVLGFVLWLLHRVDRTTFRPVREGLPIVVQVLGISKAPSIVVSGQPSNYVFHVAIQFIHPDTATPTIKMVRSKEFSAIIHDERDVSYRAGTTATAFYICGQFDKTLNLYGFAGLRDDLGVIKCKDDADPSTILGVAGIMASLFVLIAIFGGLIGAIVYEPLTFGYGDAVIPVIAGVVLFGGSFGFLFWCLERSERRRRLRRNRRAVDTGGAVEIGATTIWQQQGIGGWLLKLILIFSMPALGGGLGVGFAFTANTLFDHSTSTELPAAVTARTQTTHAGLLRMYSIETNITSTGESVEVFTTPAKLSMFATDDAIVEIVDGLFGWRCVRRIKPAPMP